MRIRENVINENQCDDSYGWITSLGVARLHDLQLDWPFTQCLVPHVQLFYSLKEKLVLQACKCCFVFGTKKCEGSFFPYGSAAFHTGLKWTFCHTCQLRTFTDKYFLPAVKLYVHFSLKTICRTNWRKTTNCSSSAYQLLDWPRINILQIKLFRQTKPLVIETWNLEE